MTPARFRAPSTDQYHRALVAVAAVTEATKTHLYAALCDLTNLDLRLVSYHLASTRLFPCPYRVNLLEAVTAT